MKKLGMAAVFVAALGIALAFAACANNSDNSAALLLLAAGSGGGSQKGSATETTEGIKITFSLPANCPIVDFKRSSGADTPSDYRTFFYKTNSSGNSVSAIDLFAEAGATYYYKAAFANSNWEVQSYSEAVKITATATGKIAPSLTNNPTITYNQESKKFTFSEAPTFAMPSLSGFGNLKYEICYKCLEDNDWSSACSFSFGELETNAIYDGVLSKHSGHRLSYTGIGLKLANENESEWYQFRIGESCTMTPTIITLP